MNILLLRRLGFAFVVLTLTVILSGCVVGGGGYGYDDGVAIGGGYYEPYGADYHGGWGPGYEVAPFRGGDHHPTRGGGDAPAHAYKSAPASRSIPSIPSRARSGGRSGGSRSR